MIIVQEDKAEFKQKVAELEAKHQETALDPATIHREVVKLADRYPEDTCAALDQVLARIKKKNGGASPTPTITVPTAGQNQGFFEAAYRLACEEHDNKKLPSPLEVTSKWRREEFNELAKEAAELDLIVKEISLPGATIRQELADRIVIDSERLILRYPTAARTAYREARDNLNRGRNEVFRGALGEDLATCRVALHTPRAIPQGGFESLEAPPNVPFFTCVARLAAHIADGPTPRPGDFLAALLSKTVSLLDSDNESVPDKQPAFPGVPSQQASRRTPAVAGVRRG